MTKNQKYPLRKIVGIQQKEIESSGYKIIRKYELLECGHLGKNIELLDNDLYGNKSANSRRCRHCIESSLKQDK